jgi:hypothetical protein
MHGLWDSSFPVCEQEPSNFFAVGLQVELLQTAFTSLADAVLEELGNLGLVMVPTRLMSC